MEVAIETKTYLVHMQCEKCGEGFMLDETPQEEIQMIMMANKPVEFKHVCNKCGYEEKYETSYPYTKLVPVDEVTDDGK